MNGAAVSALLIHLLGLSLISFGGIPSVLPDLRHFVVVENGWLSDRDFANCFAIVQVLPGPNMILMMGFIGWQVGGIRGCRRERVRDIRARPPSCASRCSAYRSGFATKRGSASCAAASRR